MKSKTLFLVIFCHRSSIALLALLFIHLKGLFLYLFKTFRWRGRELLLFARRISTFQVLLFLFQRFIQYALFHLIAFAFLCIS